MSLANQYQRQQRQGNRTFFKEGVRSAKLSQQKTTSVFRLMPAFDPENPDITQSYLPCVDPDGRVTDWGKFVHVSVFLGHGMSKRDIVSPKTFDYEAPCPLEDMWQAIYDDKITWEYLVKDNPERGTRKCFTRPSPQLIINAIDRSQIHMGVVVGLLSKSAGSALIALCGARNSNAQVLQMAEQEGQYLLGFANGDISDPNGGIMLTCGIPPASANGEFSKYEVAPLVTINPMTNRSETASMPLTCELMAQRKNVTNIGDLIEERTYEDIVADLVGLYNKRSPVNGHHEFNLLRVAFPECAHLIPEPPLAPAGSNTVAVGWDPNQAQDVNQPQINRTASAPQTGGFARQVRPMAYTPTAVAPKVGGFASPIGSPAAFTRPPAPSEVKPASVKPRKPSEKQKLAQIADESDIIVPGDKIQAYAGPATLPSGNLDEMMESISKTVKGQ